MSGFDEKRLLPRHTLLVPIPCQLSRRENSGFGWLRDLSCTGAKVISSLQLMAGDEVILLFPNTTPAELTIAATVRWTQGPFLGVAFKQTFEAVSK